MVVGVNLSGAQLSYCLAATSKLEQDTTMKEKRQKKGTSSDGILSLPINMRSHARLLGRVGKAQFQYFVINQDPKTGLVLDRDDKSAPASIAAVGFSLTAYASAVKRGWVTRQEAIAYTLKVLRTLWSAPQGDAVEGTSGFHGYFYHFLEPDTGLRATKKRYWNSELSSIDTALLMAGVLFSRSYFSGSSADEQEIRDLADKLYRRVEWDWLFREDKLVQHGWWPETGKIEHVYRGMSEAPILYLLALGSPTHPAPDGAWEAYLANAATVKAYDVEYIKMPGEPLFCYQYPHCWIDFRGIKDGVTGKFGFDLFENARRMAQVHYKYAQENPHKWAGYGGFDWGLTACDGPGDAKKEVDGIMREFRGYSERGCPTGFDDGTIAPTAALASIAYVPEIVIPTMRYWLAKRPELFKDAGGFTDSFNPTFTRPAAGGDSRQPAASGWVCQHRLGIDQGPPVILIENYRSDLVWSVMRKCDYLRVGLKKAGFKGGWLDKK
jgi:hypothetical protein